MFNSNSFKKKQSIEDSFPLLKEHNSILIDIDDDSEVTIIQEHELLEDHKIFMEGILNKLIEEYPLDTFDYRLTKDCKDLEIIEIRSQKIKLNINKYCKNIEAEEKENFIVTLRELSLFLRDFLTRKQARFLQANLLAYGNNGKPRPGLAHSNKQLIKIAFEAGPPTQDESLSFVKDEDKIKGKIIEYINSVQGSLKGPAQNAREIVDDYYALAIRAQYNLNSETVLEAVAYFLLSVATEGFEGLDNTGTLIGNFRGDWRGGGF